MATAQEREYNAPAQKQMSEVLSEIKNNLILAKEISSKSAPTESPNKLKTLFNETIGKVETLTQRGVFSEVERDIYQQLCNDCKTASEQISHPKEGGTLQALESKKTEQAIINSLESISQKVGTTLQKELNEATRRFNEGILKVLADNINSREQRQQPRSTFTTFLGMQPRDTSTASIKKLAEQAQAIDKKGELIDVKKLPDFKNGEIAHQQIISLIGKYKTQYDEKIKTISTKPSEKETLKN